MQYLNKIEYIGDPVKAVMPGGYYLWTLIASDIPVTDLKVWEFFANYKFWSPRSMDGFPLIELKFKESTELMTFIGESVIIYNLLDEMRANTFDAKATVFRIETFDTGERILVVVSDDGEGIPRQEIRDKLFNACVSTRPSGAGLALFYNGKPQLQKMAGDIKYKGFGLGGKGASFEMSFLKKMPP